MTKRIFGEPACSLSDISAKQSSTAITSGQTDKHLHCEEHFRMNIVSPSLLMNS
jgi:stress-induced morphogen